MDTLLAQLSTWMPEQRWYAAKGRAPDLRVIAAWDLENPRDAGDARLRTLLVRDDGADPPVLYQVPVVERRADAVTDGVIGKTAAGRVLVDGARDRSYTAALLRLVARGGTAGGADAGATGHAAASAPAVAVDSPARVLSGEQSNTSVIYAAEGGATPVICKIFRQVHPGHNPDIELQAALADAGSTRVPRSVGWVEGIWHDGTRAVTGSLAFAQEFLPGVEDAWRVALAAARAGDDFGERAAELGAATAEVHLALARLFPVRAATTADRAAVVAGWRSRVDQAVHEVPALAPLRSGIEAVYERAQAEPWPALQRVHGDYHLGQVLRVPGRGWVLLDFEGEPLRPMAERIAPDLALRDVAGMARSFDYVAGSLRLEGEAPWAGAWAHKARSRFLTGYRDAVAAASAVPAGEEEWAHALLVALELDKAVYELIYEARNRPAWLPIPRTAIEQLVADAAH